MPKVNFEASAHGKNLWVAVGEDVASGNAAIYTSPKPDFNNATKRTSASNSVINCIVSGKDKFVCGHKDGQFSYSLNGIDWQVSNAHEAVIGNLGITTIKYENNKFVAGGDNNIYYSNDGITWEFLTTETISNTNANSGDGGTIVGGLTYNSHQSKWFAISNKFIFTSGDGVNWNSDNQYHDGGANATFPPNVVLKDLDCNPDNGFMVASGKTGYAVYNPEAATRWSWKLANADGNPVLPGAGEHDFEGVIYVNNKFYLGGKDKMGTDAVDGDNKHILWEGDHEGKGWKKIDAGLVDGQTITGFSFSDNSLLITCVENILHIPFQEGREILLGGNISVENNLSAKGCHISIEGVSEHGNKDTEMKLVLHGDLEVSNKKISIESNDDANKLEVKGNSKINQDLTSDSTQPVTFHSVQVTQGLAAAVTVATQDDIDYQDDYDTALTATGGTSDTDKITAILAALGITTAAAGVSGSGSDGQIVNGIIKIKKSSGEYLNANTAVFNKADTDVESELALTDINGNFSLSANVTTRLNNTTTGDFFIEIQPITAADLKERNTYVGQVVTRPTYDKQADENVDMTFSNVLNQKEGGDPAGADVDYTTKNIAITPLTTIKSKMVEGGKSVAAANTALKSTFNIEDDELNQVDPYSVLEEPDAVKRDKAKKVLDRISEVMTITDSIVASTKNTAIDVANRTKTRANVFEKIATAYKGNTISIMDTGANANKIKDIKVDEIVVAVVSDATDNTADQNNTKKVVKSYLVQARAKREEDMDTTSATADLQKTNNTVEKFKQRIAKESKFVRALKEIKERIPDFDDFNATPNATNTEFIKDEIDSKEELTFTKSTPIAWELNDKDNVESTVDGAGADNFTATYRVITDGNATITLNSNASNLTLKMKYKKNRVTIKVSNIPVGQHVLELKAKIPEASEDLAVFKKITITRNAKADATGAAATLPEPAFKIQETEVEQAEDDGDETEVLDVDIADNDDEVQIEDIEDPDREKVTNVSREFQIKEGVKRKDNDATGPNNKVRGLFVRPRKFGIYKIGLIVRRKANTTLVVRKIIFLLVKPKYKIKTLKFDVSAQVVSNLFWNSSKINIKTTKGSETKRAMEIIKQIRSSTLYSRLPFTVSFGGFDGTKAIIQMKGKIAKNGSHLFYTDWVYDFAPLTIKLPDAAITVEYAQNNTDTTAGDATAILENDSNMNIALLKLPQAYNDEAAANITWTVGDGATLINVANTNNKLLRVSSAGKFVVEVEYTGSGGSAPDVKTDSATINVGAAPANNGSIIVNTTTGDVFGFTKQAVKYNVFSGDFAAALGDDLQSVVTNYRLLEGNDDKSFIAYQNGGGNLGGDKNFDKLFQMTADDKNKKLNKVSLFNGATQIDINAANIRYATWNP